MQIPGVRDPPAGDIDSIVYSAFVIMKHVDPLIIVALGRPASAAMKRNKQRILPVIARVSLFLHKKPHGFPFMGQDIEFSLFFRIRICRYHFFRQSDLRIQFLFQVFVLIKLSGYFLHHFVDFFFCKVR